MKFIIVRNGENVIEKNVYGGDDDANMALISVLQAKNPLLSYEEVDEKSFSSIETKIPMTKDQTDWQTEKSKGTTQAILFMAKKLGLE